MQAPIDKLEAADEVIREIERDKNVCFERFDLSEVRTFDEFRARAIEAGWENRGHRLVCSGDHHGSALWVCVTTSPGAWRRQPAR